MKMKNLTTTAFLACIALASCNKNKNTRSVEDSANADMAASKAVEKTSDAPHAKTGNGADEHKAPIEKTPTVQNVVENPMKFLGRAVNLTGEVKKKHNPYGYVLEGKDWDLWDDEILVVTTTALPANIKEGTLVKLQGTVSKYGDIEVEQEVEKGLQEIEFDYEEKPFVHSQSITVVEK